MPTTLLRGPPKIFRTGDSPGTQRAKFAEKVHKPPLGFIVINFELNELNASI